MLSPPIITKGYPYPKIVKLASKSANRKLHNSVVANLPTLTNKGHATWRALCLAGVAVRFALFCAASGTECRSAFAARRSASLLARRRACESSNLPHKLEYPAWGFASRYMQKKIDHPQKRTPWRPFLPLSPFCHKKHLVES